jgi:hypothetical protein
MSKRKRTKQETYEAFWNEQFDRAWDAVNAFADDAVDNKQIEPDTLAWCMLSEACHMLCDLSDSLDDARQRIMEEIESVLRDEVEELQASRDKDHDDEEDREQQLAWLARHERIED